jgi:hypothetical protein
MSGGTQAVSPCLGFGKRSDLGEQNRETETGHDQGEILLAESQSAQLVGGTPYYLGSMTKTKYRYGYWPHS